MKKLLITSIIILISITSAFYFYYSENKFRKSEEEYIYILAGDSLRYLALELHEMGQNLLTNRSYDSRYFSYKFIYSAREAGKISGYMRHLNYIENSRRFTYDEIKTWENFQAILLSLSNSLNSSGMSEQETRKVGKELMVISDILGYKKFRPESNWERISTKFGREILLELNHTELNEHLNHIYSINRN